MKNIILNFRNGMFQAASRTYGETYMEPIIRKKKGLSESATGENDAENSEGKFEEIKCSKVLRTKIKKDFLLESILSENENSVLGRLVKFDDCYTEKYDSNIQNVKRDHFSILKYVMLFSDCIKIFESHADDISKIPNWCNTHGRYDAYGKSGQFNIKNTNIKWHLENNLVDTLLWEEAYQIADSI
jgi:hypothetical protein